MKQEIIKALEATKARSAWKRGVIAYAQELLENFTEAELREYALLDGNGAKDFQNTALNGAKDWSAYSWGGCSLIYDYDIAARLCSPSELKRTRNGERRPNAREEWLDTQARALFQAYRLLWWTMQGIINLQKGV